MSNVADGLADSTLKAPSNGLFASSSSGTVSPLIVAASSGSTSAPSGAGSRWGSSPGTRPSSIRWSMCGATGTLEGAHGSWPSAVTVVALFVHPDVRGFPGTLCLQIWLAVIRPVPVLLMVYRHPHEKELQFVFPPPTVSMSVGWLM